jgi:two-component system, NarL family, response regulator LiaR
MVTFLHETAKAMYSQYPNLGTPLIKAMTTDNIETNHNPDSKKITVLIVDNHPIVHQSLNSIIEQQKDMEVIASAKNGQEAIQLATSLLPNIVIMDIAMPVMNGLEATRQIKAKFPNIAILVFTVHTDKEYILKILEAGAAGYLTKDVYGGDVIHAIRAIIAGETVLSPSVLQEILKYNYQEPIKTVSGNTNKNLTAKEISLLRLAARGLNNKNIANELNISENTVKSYLAQLFQKMNVSSRTEAVVCGLKDGLIAFNDLG